MSQGKFRLMIMLAGKDEFGELETFSYDDASLTKANRRERTLEAVYMRRDGWDRNYANFRDASFRIEEISTDAKGQEQRQIISGMKDQPKVEVVDKLKVLFDERNQGAINAVFAAQDQLVYRFNAEQKMTPAEKSEARRIIKRRAGAPGIV